MTDLDLETDQQAAHELLAHLDSLEGLPHALAAPPASRQLPGTKMLRAVYPGLIVAIVIGLAATWLSSHYQAPVMLFALLLGMAFHFLHEEGRCIPGIEFSSKAILRAGVALLGARITATQILSLGVMPIATVLVAVSTTIAVGFLIARWLGLSRSLGVLSGGAVGICGASAALAIATVLPQNKDSERDTILTVVAITAMATIAMIVYPMLATAIGLDHVRAGIFLGGTIHDVAQVVGAGYSISPQTGDIATYVKLLRVTLLLPVVFAIAVVVARAHAGAVTGARAPLPWFLFGFAALVAINSLGWLPKVVAGAANDISRDCLVIAIAALGMKTSFKELITVGWRPIALMAAETAWIGALVLVAVELFG